jgi:hypothetical protein
VTTPDGKLVAMSHSNNFTSEPGALVDLFDEAFKAMGVNVVKSKLYEIFIINHWRVIPTVVVYYLMVTFSGNI